MKSKSTAALMILTILVSVTALADTPREPVASQHIRITAEHRAQLTELSRLLSIDRVQGLVVEGEASPRQLEALRRAGFSWTSLPRPPAKRATMCPEGWGDNPGRGWDCYPTYPEYVAFLEWLAAQYPELCRLERIGWTTNQVRPHELLVLKISDNPDLEEDEPEVFLTSSIHGDETVGWVLLMRLAAELLADSAAEPELGRLVEHVELWINPLANPDGTYYGGDGTVRSAIRYYTTASGSVSYVDGNRNFPDPRTGDHPDGHSWWRETVAMMDFAATHSISLSANLHGGIEVVNYPWDTWARRHADDDWFVALSRAYATQVHEDAWPGYMRALDDGITNGYDWYQVAGGRQDFMTYFHGAREITIELSDVKLLAAHELPAHYEANRQALLDFIGASLEGIRGVISDPGGRPVEATVELVGHDLAADRSWVYCDPDEGDFHRMVLPGVYDLRISAPGFATLEHPGVVVSEGEATRVNLTLYPAAPRRSNGRR